MGCTGSSACHLFNLLQDHHRADRFAADQVDPLHGCVAAALGSLTALTAILVLAGLGFQGLIAVLPIEQSEVHNQLPVTLLGERPFLDRQHRSLTFRVTTSAKAQAIRLKPRGIMADRDAGHAKIRIRVDGAPLHPGWIENAGDAIALELTPPRPIREIVLERQSGPGLVLHLPARSVEVVSQATHSNWLNCVIALLSYLSAAVLALAVMILGHAYLALPVNLAAGLVVCLLATLLELTPSTAAISAFARGRWVLGAVPGDPLSQVLWTTALGIGLIGLTWLLNRTTRGYARRWPRTDGGVSSRR